MRYHELIWNQLHFIIYKDDVTGLSDCPNTWSKSSTKTCSRVLLSGICLLKVNRGNTSTMIGAVLFSLLLTVYRLQTEYRFFWCVYCWLWASKYLLSLLMTLITYYTTTFISPNQYRTAKHPPQLKWGNSNFNNTKTLPVNKTLKYLWHINVITLYNFNNWM